MQNERWEPLPRYGLILLAPNYFVSDMGRIRGCAGIVRGSMQAGYRRTILKRASGSHDVRILFHRAVCQAFHGEQPGSGHSVDHINRNPADNRATNLRWSTTVEQLANRECPTQKTNRRTVFQSSKTKYFEKFDECEPGVYSLAQLRQAALHTPPFFWSVLAAQATR